jgi:hypothetical protein
VLDSLKKILCLHNAIEENLVYPAIAKIGKRKNQALELFHQTAAADIAVFTLQQALLHRDEATFTGTAKS